MSTLDTNSLAGLEREGEEKGGDRIVRRYRNLSPSFRPTLWEDWDDTIMMTRTFVGAKILSKRISKKSRSQ